MAKRGNGAKLTVPITVRQAAGARKLSIAQVEKMISMRAVTPEQIVAMPDPILRRMVRRIKFVDLPSQRERFRLLHLQGDGGGINPSRYLMAIHQQNHLRSIATKGSVAGVPVGTIKSPLVLMEPRGGLGHWSALGPRNIGGRTRSIVIDPKTPAKMLAGSVGGGIWRTRDGGVTWGPVDDLMANLAVCCLIIDPTDSNIVYAGTGEGFSNDDAIRGAGIFGHGDDEWIQLSSTSRFQAVNRLAISPDGKVLLAATPDGLFRVRHQSF